MAGRGAGAAAVFRRSRPIRGRPAPRRRHRRRARPRRARTCRRHRLLRRLRARRRPRGHDHDRRRLRRDGAPTRGDERRARQRGQGGSGGRRGRREQRLRHLPATRPPRRSRRRRPERVRRPARPAACAAAGTAAGARAAGRRSGSSCDRRDPGAAARTGGDRDRRAGRGDVAARPCRRDACRRAPRDRAALCGQAGRDRDRRAGGAPSRLAAAREARHDGEAGNPVACRRERARDDHGSESRCNAASERVTAGCRHTPARQAEGVCATGPAAANAAGRRSTGRSAPARERCPARHTTGRARSGPLHPRAHDPCARCRSRRTGAAQACAYHPWR